MVWPASRQNAKWIELINKGDLPVNVSNWAISDRSGNTVALGDRVEPIPSGGLVLIVLGNPSSLSISHAVSKFVIVDILPEKAARLFEDKTNECALYRSPVPSLSNIVDYLCWDRRADFRTTNHQYACDAMMWRRGGGVYIGLDSAPGDREPLLPGGTLARMEYVKNWRAVNDWFICTPEEATPGKANVWLPPVPHTYGKEMRISYDEDNGTSFAWRGKQNSIAQSRIQIAPDDTFQQISTDVVTNSPYVRRPSLPPGKYFWRVRCEWDATNTVWSPSARLTITEGPGYPVKDAKKKGEKDKQ
jgi:hypothetical protein